MTETKHEGLPVACNRPQTETKHEGLPVAGYRPQTETKIAAVNVNKELEERILRQLDALADAAELAVDRRWLAIGRTSIEQGFMAINRAVFQPSRIELKS